MSNDLAQASIDETRQRSFLVVDDSRRSARRLAEILRSHGAVHVAFDARTAVDLLRRHPPDVIFYDADLAEAPIDAFMERAKAYLESTEARVVGLAVRGSDDHGRRMEAGGVEKTLYKPFDADEVLPHTLDRNWIAIYGDVAVIDLLGRTDGDEALLALSPDALFDLADDGVFEIVVRPHGEIPKDVADALDSFAAFARTMGFEVDMPILALEDDDDELEDEAAAPAPEPVEDADDSWEIDESEDDESAGEPAEAASPAEAPAADGADGQDEAEVEDEAKVSEAVEEAEGEEVSEPVEAPVEEAVEEEAAEAPDEAPADGEEDWDDFEGLDDFSDCEGLSSIPGLSDLKPPEEPEEAPEEAPDDFLADWAA